MKKILIITLVFIAAAVGLLLLSYAAKYTGKAYRLAQDLKKGGLPIESIQITESNAMYDEVAVTGGGLNIKINHYGNGLFMESIEKNLEEENRGRDKESRIPIYVSGLFIIVVYQEPAKGGVKAALINKLGEIREF